MQIDETDTSLLNALRKDARRPVAALAKALGLARSTVQARIDRLEAQGMIAGYTVVLGDAAQAAQIRATALLQIEPRSLPAILSRLKAMPEVVAAHTTSGRFDLILTLHTETTARLDTALDLIGAIPGVKSSESLIHLSTRL